MYATKKSEAYDLSLFEKRNKNLKVLPVQKKSKQRKTQTISRVMIMAKIVAVFITIFALTGMFIFTRVQINELSNDVSRSGKQLDMLKSENVRLNMELESRISLDKVEKYAKENGLQKIEKSQVSYVSLSHSDKVYINEEYKNSGIFTRSFKKISEFWEYIAH
jgi:cell division protein FtsL